MIQVVGTPLTSQQEDIQYRVETHQPNITEHVALYFTVSIPK